MHGGQTIAALMFADESLAPRMILSTFRCNAVSGSEVTSSIPSQSSKTFSRLTPYVLAPKSSKARMPVPEV